MPAQNVRRRPRLAGTHVDARGCTDRACSLRWQVSEEIKRRFRRFLTKHDGSGSEESTSPSKYAERVRAMCAANSQSLEVRCRPSSCYGSCGQVNLGGTVLAVRWARPRHETRELRLCSPTPPTRAPPWPNVTLVRRR